jgi:hypothetical protein
MHVCVWVTTGVTVEIIDGKVYGGRDQQCYGCGSFLTRIGIDLPGQSLHLPHDEIRSSRTARLTTRVV